MYFSGGATDEQSKIDISIDHSDSPGSTIDVPVTTVNAIGEDLVGEVTNTTDGSVRGPVSIMVGCFDTDGTLLGINETGFTEKDELAAGAKSGFSVRLGNDDCPTFLVAATGYNF